MKQLSILLENNTKIIALVLLILMLLFFFTPLFGESTDMIAATGTQNISGSTCTFMIFKNLADYFKSLRTSFQYTDLDKTTINLVLYNVIANAVILAINMALVLTLLILSFFATRYATALLAGTILPIGVLFAVFGGMSWMNPSAAFFFILIAFVISVLCVIAYVNKATITRYARMKALAANKTVEEHTEENTEVQDENATI